jgi:hypothetical protein
MSLEGEFTSHGYVGVVSVLDSPEVQTVKETRMDRVCKLSALGLLFKLSNNNHMEMQRLCHA